MTTLLTDLTSTVADRAAWVTIGLGLLMALAIGLAGAAICRRSGLLGDQTGKAATISVGLAMGCCVAAPLWAAIASGGRSAFVPVAVTFVFGVAMLLRRRGAASSRDAAPRPTIGRTEWLPALAATALALVAAALLYGTAHAPRAQDGLQPLEYRDEAFYAILGRDLDDSGVESVFSPSGFASLVDAPPQTWYHWGELWLGAAVMRLSDASALDARNLVVLPILLVAAAGTAGAFVQSFGRTRSGSAFLLGVAGSLILAPVPWLIGPFHAFSTSGLVVLLSTYGLAAVAAILLLHSLSVLSVRAPTWGTALIVGGTLALLLPAHILLFLLACAGSATGIAWYAFTARTGRERSLMLDHAIRIGLVVVATTSATFAWGLLTGHGLGGNGLSVGVAPFGDAWQRSVFAAAGGAGTLLVVPVAGWLLRREDPYRSAIAVGVAGIVVAGAIAWGARLADYNMFHVFYSGIVVFLAPAAAASVWVIATRLRTHGHRLAASALIAVCIAQLAVGGLASMIRLRPPIEHGIAAVPTSMLDAMRALPAEAKLAYACQPSHEIGIWVPALASLDAHTGRRMVAMCFQPDNLGMLIGARDPDAMSPLFAAAPQRELYPSAETNPSPEAVVAFLREHGIGYIYQDAVHSATLVPDAIEVFADGDFRLLRVP